MDINTLCSELARREGGKKQVLNVAQAHEVVAILGDILAEMGWVKAVRLCLAIRKRGKMRDKK